MNTLLRLVRGALEWVVQKAIKKYNHAIREVYTSIAAGRTLASKDLATYPSKGNRQELDRCWLALLHREGLMPFLDSEPEPPAALSLAIQEFNQGQYWQCHETLEGIWLPEHYPLRLFYHGLIKAAVGLLHLERHNRHGALVKLRDADYTLAPFLPQFIGVDTDRLRRDIIERLTLLTANGPVAWTAIDQLPPVQILYHPQS